MHLQSVTLHPDRYPTDEHYPFNLPLFRCPATYEFTTPVTFFVGENGSGKSTLVTALARKCGIHMWRDADRRRFEVNPWEQRLHHHISVKWEAGPVPGSYFGSDTFRHFAMVLDEWAASDPGQLKYFGGASLMTQSHGQSLMSFFRARYQIRGLYLLDEPETALSPRSQLDLLALLVEMGRRGHAQFIIATHSPILMACPGATILSFDSVPAGEIAYEDTEHYRIYRDFMMDPQKYVDAL